MLPRSEPEGRAAVGTGLPETSPGSRFAEGGVDEVRPAVPAVEVCEDCGRTFAPGRLQAHAKVRGFLLSAPGLRCRCPEFVGGVLEWGFGSIGRLVCS